MGRHPPNSWQAQKRRGVSHGRRKHSAAKAGFAQQVILGSLVVGAVSWTLAPQLSAAWNQATSSAEEIAARERSVYYRNCDAARAADAAPIYAGTPGYRTGMDGDSDGIACEPYR